MAYQRRKREFPVEIPEYIRLFCDDQQEAPDRDVWIMRSEYERRQARRLIQNEVVFLYEHIQITYFAEVHNGVCAVCGSDYVKSGRVYTPDFYFPETKVFVETKGKFDSQNRTMMKIIVNNTPQDVRMVLMRDNWLTKKKKMNYSRWCTLNGVNYAIGDIPLEWGRSNEVG
jgi:hypothetical protein